MHSRIICVAVLVVSLVFVSSCRGPEAEGISFDDENGRLLVLYDYWHSRGQEVLIYDGNLQNSI